jgi:tape measure domain-containing protein
MSLTVKIRGDASHFEKTMSGVKRDIKGLTVGIAAFGTAAVAASVAGAYGVVRLAKGASDAASDFEQLTMQFETLTKSGEVTQKLLAEMRADAAKSPLSISDYANAGKTLLAFGGDAQTLMDTLRVLGDVSMGNSDRFGSLALAFAQTQAAGRLMGQEVLQFINAGFNPLQQISKKTGESMGELKKRMEDGAISAAEVKQAFKDATSEGGLFYQAIQKGGETTAGKIAKVKDGILSLQIAFGTGLNEGVKAGADAMVQGLSSVEKIAEEAGETVGAGIVNAINGDLELIIETGKLVGSALLDGMKLSLQGAGGELLAGLASMADKVAEYGHVDKDLGGAGFAKDIRKASRGVVSDNFEIAVFEITEAARELREKAKADAEFKEYIKGRFAAGVRSGSPGNTPQMDAMLRQLERIANAVDQPFPN